MSYTYLQELGEESSAECFSDIPVFVLSRLNLTHEKSSSKDSETESCPTSPYGMTLQRSTGTRGADSLMWYVGDSPVRTYLPPEKVKESEGESGQDFGPSSPESFAKYNPHTYTWKTAQCSLFGGLTSFLGTWPRWGMMQDGECFPLPMLEHDTSVKGYGAWPTPTKWEEKYVNSKSPGDHYHGIGWILWNQYNLQPRPEIYQEMMGWPIGWTNLKPLEMDKFQQWLNSHGKSYQEETI